MNNTPLELVEKFPRTRYMGSKQKLIKFIYDNVKKLEFETALDAFNGSGTVAYLFKSMGKEVHTNDFLKFSFMLAKATVENNRVKLTPSDKEFLLNGHALKRDNFISETFKNLYYTDVDNKFLDKTYNNIQLLKNNYKKSLALTALARACIKKRPRGIFTYTGHRYDDGRRDVRISMEKQFIEAIDVLNASITNNHKRNKAFNMDVFDLPKNHYDLVYIDPPYYSSHSDNDYSRRYHFVEGLMTKWSHVEINHDTKTKKFDKFSTPFDSRSTVYDAFDSLFKKFSDSILVVSYSSNSLPSLNEMKKIMKRYKSKVVVKEFKHKYSFGTQKKNLKNNSVKEYLFIGT